MNMRMSDIELLYNYNPIVYVNIKNFKFRLKSDRLFYVHVPKVYSGELLGYVICAVCQKHTFVLSYMDGQPYIIPNIDDIHKIVKDELGIEYQSYEYADDDSVVVYDSECGGYMTLKKVLKLQDDYFRGYFDKRIKSFQVLGIKDEEPDDTKKDSVVNYDRVMTILLIILLCVSIFNDFS